MFSSLIMPGHLCNLHQVFEKSESLDYIILRTFQQNGEAIKIRTKKHFSLLPYGSIRERASTSGLKLALMVGLWKRGGNTSEEARNYNPRQSPSTGHQPLVSLGRCPCPQVLTSRGCVRQAALQDK